MATTTDLDIGIEAESVIERIKHVAPARSLDRARAEAAIADYLDALGLEPRPVRWIPDEGDPLASARAGFKAAWETMCRKGRPEAPGFWSTATHTALYGPGLRRGGLIGEAEKQEKAAGFSVRHHTHRVDKAVGHRLEGPLFVASRHSDLARAAEDALGEKGLHRRTTMAQAVGSTPQVQRARQDAELNREIALGDATAQAVQAAYWFARAHEVSVAGKPTDAMARAAHGLLPRVDAVEAGLWLFWVAEDVVIAVARPAA